MQSEKSTVGNEEAMLGRALDAAERFITEAQIKGKKALHVNLLAEEVLSMVGAMVGDYSARFWLESGKGECRIYVDAIADMDNQKKWDLLSVSKSGKNAANKGLMAKIGEFFETSLHEYNVIMQDPNMNMVDVYGYSFSAGISAHTVMASTGALWSLSKYRTTVTEDMDDQDEAKEAWDELEKSIIANLADDVIVGVKDNRATLTIIKKL